MIETSKEKWNFFTTISIWPKRIHFDPYGWISNFSDDEKKYALRLLDGFTYFSADLVNQMFRSTYLNMSQYVIKNKYDFKMAQQEWSDFISNIIIVRVEGEIPSDADSGFHFARLARDILGIDEINLVTPEKALSLIKCGRSVNVVFVDDFVGSGNQFVETWFRNYDPSGSENLSFNSVAKEIDAGIDFFYIPIICTEIGKERINNFCPLVKIIPAHFYGQQQSALSHNSSIWRDDLKDIGPSFIHQVSERAGIPFLNGKVGCRTGFNSLGLSLAFSHGWPDATLPIYYFNDNGWKPLLKKGVA